MTHQSIIKAEIINQLAKRHLRPAHLARLAADGGVCCRSTVFKWLKGGRSISVDVAEQLAELLGLTVATTSQKRTTPPRVERTGHQATATGPVSIRPVSCSIT